MLYIRSVLILAHVQTQIHSRNHFCSRNSYCGSLQFTEHRQDAGRTALPSRDALQITSRGRA